MNFIDQLNDATTKIIKTLAVSAAILTAGALVVPSCVKAVDNASAQRYEDHKENYKLQVFKMPDLNHDGFREYFAITDDMRYSLYKSYAWTNTAIISGDIKDPMKPHLKYITPTSDLNGDGIDDLIGDRYNLFPPLIPLISINENRWATPAMYAEIMATTNSHADLYDIVNEGYLNEKR